MILLQSQPFGRQDPWAVVHHTAAASTLRAVCTVLHQLIQLSLSGARPRVNFSSSSRSEAAHLRGMTPGRWADAADRVTDIEKPQVSSTTEQTRQTRIESRILRRLKLLLKRDHQRVCDQQAGGPGARREPRRKRRTVCSALPTAWEIASAGHAPYPSTESGDAANEKLQTAFFGYQSS